MSALHALDDYLFVNSFFFLDEHGQALDTATPGLDGRPHRGGKPATLTFATAATLREKAAEFPRARAMVGTLREGAWAVDVDPTDAGADPVFGDAAAEGLVKWAYEHRLELVVRESGRPGGRHLVLVDVPEQLVDELRQVAAELATGLGVDITVRTSLRLLASPHRLGLPAPILFSNVTVPDTWSKASRPKSVTLSGTKDKGRSPRSGRVSVATGGRGDRSDSGVEFGRAMQRARAGASVRQAFEGVLECQVVRRGGFEQWRHYVWSAVVTTLAAERGHSEDQAWAWLCAEAPSRAEELGRDGWRPRWAIAVREAADVDRPRRYLPYVPASEKAPDLDEHADTEDRPPVADAENRADMTPEQRRAARLAEVELLRETLHQAVTGLLAQRRPQVARSMAAVVDVFAEALAGTGRISVRRLAEAAQVSDNTVAQRRAELLDAGVLQRAATYRADGQACDLYVLGPAAMQIRAQLAKTSVKSCTPPRPRTQGTADPLKLRTRHQAQRAAYRPALTSANTEAIKKAYPAGVCHGSSIAASRLRQRAWWEGLPEAEKAERIEWIRHRNDAMSADDRDLWFGWLDARAAVDEALDRLLDGTANARDRAVLDRAPMTVHHGRRDPLWRVGGTRPCLTASVPQRAVQTALMPTPRRASRPGNLTSAGSRRPPPRVQRP
ncbi:hypothetical protein SAMN04488074_13639 [Lentzea albidocapillata subsp. violacea]|uniref:Uncharacterized protein n=1 Tax=Lentzea albidocapillata subsp. violacea TaxID=128104 RepID=A0A1G9YZ28_9PSEU|nr:hypothetical protein [Lentzea albidocapillata]SDN14402.1 hypothetical protein SAMN04488074_13639 [Lentzea albidocapillata subsp. violacea]